MNLDRRIFAVASWLAILAPILLLAGPAAQDIGAALVAVLFLAHVTITRDWGWLHQRWFRAALLLWLAMGLRNLFTDDPLETVTRSLVFIRYPIFAAALGCWLLCDAVTARRLWIALAIALTLLIIDCFFQYTTGHDITGRAMVPNAGLMRLTGPFSNPRVGITIVWLIFPLLLPALVERKCLGAFLLIGAMLATYLSGERMAMGLLLMGLGLSFLLHPASRLLALAATTVVLVAGAGLSLAHPELVTREYAHTRADVVGFADSAYGRTWNAAFHIWQAHPLIGVGSKGFQKECAKPAYGPTDEASILARCPMHAHNIYLEWLVEFGVMGLVLFLLLAAALIRESRRGMGALSLGLSIALIIRLWPVSVTPSQFVTWSAVPCWMLVGWWISIFCCTKPGREQQ